MSKELKALELVYDAEIDGRLLPSKARIYQQLSTAGMVEYTKRTVGSDLFGAIVETGWALTHRGRILYCQSCADPDA